MKQQQARPKVGILGPAESVLITIVLVSMDFGGRH